jgi:hypothetical protein
MKRLKRRSLALASVLAVLVTLTLSAPAWAAAEGSQSADDYTPPRTAWGDPLIQGAFTTNSLTPLERPEQLGTQEFYTPEEYAEIVERRRGQPVETITEEDRNRGERGDIHYDFAQYGLVAGQNEFSPNLRTSIIVDPPNGRLPEQVGGRGGRGGRGGGGGGGVAGRTAIAARPDDGGPESRSLTERCILWTSTMAPVLPGGYNSNLHIFQAPGYVVIQAEMGDARVVPTDGRDLSDDVPQWNGSSVGRWEGDTLVVETTNFRPEANWRGTSPDRKITERFRRISDDAIEYGFTVEDPATWTQPWTGVYSLAEIEGPLYEYACHEGNYGMANIMAGLRRDEEAAAASGQ